MPAMGYAFIGSDGEPFLTTVSNSPRAAMVNALVLIFKEPVFQQDSDNKIKAKFDKLKPKGTKISRVAVTAITLIT